MARIDANVINDTDGFLDGVRYGEVSTGAHMQCSVDSILLSKLPMLHKLVLIGLWIENEHFEICCNSDEDDAVAHLASRLDCNEQSIREAIRFFHQKGILSSSESIDWCILEDYRQEVFKGKRVQISKSLRFKILQRDDFKCVYCGRRPPDVALHIDHVHPVSRGGCNDPSNLVAACQDCNLGKFTKIIGGDSNG